LSFQHVPQRTVSLKKLPEGTGGCADSAPKTARKAAGERKPARSDGGRSACLEEKLGLGRI
jgi:hypothetical protein